MGADLIGWRNCPLQAPLGPEGFRGKLKLRRYAQAVEEQIPPEQRQAVAITVEIHGPDGVRQTKMDYPSILAASETFRRGIPECASCPLSGGAPLGCYRYVTYPVDAVFEELVFAFFAANVATKDSICDQLYRGLMADLPAQGTSWHTRRGEEFGALARRPEPLVHTWGSLFWKKRLDSAQILRSLWVPMRDPGPVVAFARFWMELSAFAEARGVTPEASRTLREVKDALPMFIVTAAHAVEGGWTIEVDA